MDKLERRVKLKVNGVEYEGDVESRMLLVDFIRDELGLTATHIGCGMGKCGACTVILNGEAVKSCTILACEVDGAEVLTIEGLAKNGALHPIQEAFWANDAFQCGYCTSGMILTTYQLLTGNPSPSEDDIRKGISGNLCRCTGYVNIVKAIKAAAETIAKSSHH